MRTTSETVYYDHVIWGEFGPGRTVRASETTTYVHLDTEREKESFFNDVQLAKKLIKDHHGLDFNQRLHMLCDQYFNENIYPKYISELNKYNALPKWKRFFKFKPQVPQLVAILIPNFVNDILERINNISSMSDDIRTLYTPIEKHLYEQIISIEDTLDKLDSYINITNIHRRGDGGISEVYLVLDVGKCVSILDYTYLYR